MRANWSLEETELLKKIYHIKTSNELQEFFPQYTNTQILRKAKRLGLKKSPAVAKQSRLSNSIIQRNDLWSDEEKRIVLENYEQLGAKGVKELLNNHRSEEQIKKTAYRLGVRREQKTTIWEQTEINIYQERFLSVEFVYKRR
ncbi:hypothetical protein MKX78_10840 [Cytobacillus sp. FSL R5-0569]|uniref:hypothetical protein n=1 Tax=Cytobacillus sp. FSL R5-0569 TaxID=2921649 RepID=UPI0030FCC098